MKLGFIGAGKMATALVEGLIGAEVCQPDEIVVSDVSGEALSKLSGKCGILTASENAECAAQADAVLLCVKPQDARAVLDGIAGELDGKLLISIAAGLPISSLVDATGEGVRVIRVMPNTPSLLGKGAACFAAGPGATEEDRSLALEIFSAVGRAFEVKEELLDAVTGLSGSGPAYAYLVIEALADGGVLEGLPRDLALQLASQTVAGAAEMVIQSGLHPAQLKDMVTSPGGTTIAGLDHLEACGLRSALIGAVQAASERSRELAG